jgi:hypothetical protein
MEQELTSADSLPLIPGERLGSTTSIDMDKRFSAPMLRHQYKESDICDDRKISVLSISKVPETAESEEHPLIALHTGIKNMEEQVIKSFTYDDMQTKRLLVNTLEERLADSIAKQVEYKKEMDHLSSLLEESGVKLDKDKLPETNLPRSLKIEPLGDVSSILRSKLEVLRQERRALQDVLLSSYLGQIRKVLCEWMSKYHSMENENERYRKKVMQLEDQLALKAEENILITDLLANQHEDLQLKQIKLIEQADTEATRLLKEENQNLKESLSRSRSEKEEQLQLSSAMQIHFEAMQNDMQVRLEQLTCKVDQWKHQYEAIEKSYEHLKVLYQEMYNINSKHREIMSTKSKKWRDQYKHLHESLRQIQAKLEFYIRSLPKETVQEKEAQWKAVELDNSVLGNEERKNEYEDYDLDIELGQDDATLKMLDLTAVLSYLAAPTNDDVFS